MSDSFAADPSRVMHVAVLSVFCFFAVVAVIFRLWARRVQRATWEVNDYLCLVGAVFAVALSLFTIHSQVYWDLGEDSTQVGNPQAILRLVILQIQAMIVGEILWIASVFFIRASVLQLYIRLFRTKSFRIVCYVVHAINFLYFATTVLAACLICRPIAFNWDQNIPGGSCGDQKSLGIYIGVFNLFMDIAVVALPMPVLWGLQMATQKKFAISVMFGMGTIICIITLIRIWVTSLVRGESNAQKIYAVVALLTCLEALLGVVNACLPVMKPVFSKFSESKLWTTFSKSFPSIMSTSNGPSSSSAGGANSFSQKAPARKQYRAKNGAMAGVFGSSKEMQAWPSGVSTTNGSPDANMHRFVDNKAAQIMFSHTTSGATSRNGSPRVDFPPRPPPKSKYYSPDKVLGEKGELEIVVKRDWDVDVERGEAEAEAARAGSDDTDRELLREGMYGRAQ